MISQKSLDRKTEKVREYILGAVKNPSDLPLVIYTQRIRDDAFWYKTFFITPVGCLRCDTRCIDNSGGVLITKVRVMRVIKSENLGKVTFDELFSNWETYKLWDFRKFEKRLMEAQYSERCPWGYCFVDDAAEKPAGG